MPSLTERKLMPMGKGALVVTIPKGWARYLKLKPGDKVEIEANDNLIIRRLKGQSNGKAKEKAKANQP